MDTIVISIIFSVIVYLVIGGVVCVVVSELSTECYADEEMLAIFIFYPIIALAAATLGIIKIAIRILKSLDECVRGE